MKSYKKTLAYFIERAQRTHGNRYDYSQTDYKNTTTKVKIICRLHGAFYQAPLSHIHGTNCPTCSRMNLVDSTAKFISKASKIHKNKYDYTDTEYVTSSTPVKIKCPIHGIFLQPPNRHLFGNGCPACGKQTRTRKPSTNHHHAKQFLAKATARHHNKYDYSKIVYKNSRTKIKILCPIHGEFFQSPTHHLYGHGCPKCRASHGESIIRGYLQNKGIEFEEQKRFADCKHNNLLVFDFYIQKHRIFIEYQGQQHYRYVPYFHKKTPNALTEQKIRDSIKKDYAESHGIYVEISYKDDIIMSLQQQIPQA